MMKIQLKLIIAFAAMLTTAFTNASHFRGGAINASVDASGVLTLTQTSFWRKAFPEGNLTIRVAGGTLASTQNVSTSGSIDQTDARFAVSTSSGTFQLPGAGLYTFNYSSCCRVGGGVNFDQDDFDMQGAIRWDGNNANAPILFDFASISNEVVAGADYDQNLNAVGIDLAYDQALNIEINSQPPGFTIDPTTGQMNIPAASTATYGQNTSNNDGADYAFSGNIKAGDDSFTQFDWVFDVVTTATNLAPNLMDMTVNGLIGDILTGTMTGFDPEGNTLTWFIQSVLGFDLSRFTFDPNTQEFSLDTTGMTAGQYVANIGANDGALNGFGAITFNLANPTGAKIPEPSVVVLLLIAGGLLFRVRTAK